MSNSIQVEIQSALPHKNTWSKVRFDFFPAEVAGVDKGLFEALWENYEPASDDTDKMRKKWKSIRSAIKSIEDEYADLQKIETYHWADFGDKLFDLWMISDTAWDYLYEKKVYVARHYWAGALWPYFRMKKATHLWGWLAKWIRYVEQNELKFVSGKNLASRTPSTRAISKTMTEGERMKKWANSVRRKSLTVNVLHQNNRFTKGAISSQLSTLCESGRSDLMAISMGVFNTLLWISGGKGNKTERLSAAKNYLGSASKRWPFLKRICPRCTWELLATLRKIQQA